MNPVQFEPSLTQIRRHKQAITDEDRIKRFLRRAPVGVLATCVQEQPYLSTRLFVYDEPQHAIYMHAADQGRTLESIRANPQVCFTTFEMGRFVPAKKARNFGVEYESVVVFGQASLVEDEQEMIRALKQFMAKYAPQFQPGVDYPEIQASDLMGLAVYRIEILGWSAKHDAEPPDHPGAYFYRYPEG